MEIKKYSLPELPYSLDALAPYISKEQLSVHYEKHHQAYVDGANALLEKTDSLKSGEAIDERALAKAFAFQVGGFVLHDLFWKNLAPAGASVLPDGEFKAALDDNFGSIDSFKNRFSQLAKSVEGSGWAALAQCPLTGRLQLMQIEKHNVNVYPGFRIILVLDMFEHAYYIDHKNDKNKYVDNFWQIVDWNEAAKRYSS